MWGETEAAGLSRGRVALIMAVVAVMAGGLLGWRGERAAPPEPIEESGTVGRLSLIEVHVAGWVNAPGVVSLAEGSIVADAIDSAGGLREGALVDSINLAAPVSAGDQVLVPGPNDGSFGGTEDGGLISLNRSSARDLEALPGVGPVLAGRIVAFRESNGPFSAVEDLLQVPGIGEAKLASIRDLVRVP